MSVQAMTWAFTQDLPAGEKVVLLVLANRFNEDQHGLFPGQSTIAKEASMGERTARRHLAELEERGLITRTPRMRSEGRGRTSDFIRLNIDQPADQAVRSDGPTGQNASDQPANVGRASKEDLNVREPKGGARKRAGTPCPEEFKLNPEDRDWAEQNAPTVDVTMSTKQFVTYWRSTGGLKVRWKQAWRNWLLKDEQRNANGRQSARTFL